MTAQNRKKVFTNHIYGDIRDTIFPVYRLFDCSVGKESACTGRKHRRCGSKSLDWKVPGGGSDNPSVVLPGRIQFKGSQRSVSQIVKDKDSLYKF